MKIQSFKILNGKAFVVQIVILLLVLLVIGESVYLYTDYRNDELREQNNSGMDNYSPEPIQSERKEVFTTPTVTPQPSVKVSSIKVLTPNGGEVWVRNSYNTISWDVSNKIESTLFDIKLVRKNSTSPATTAFIQEGQSSSQNKYLWKTGDTYSTMFVPSTGDSTVEFPGAGQYVIQVCIHQTDNCDSSNANFTFKEPSVRVIAPNNSGLQLVSGSAYQIKWEYFNVTNTSQVDLYLEKINDFDCYNSIKSLDCSLSNRSSEIILDKNIPSNTAYYWVVGTDIANKPINPGDYRMKICVAGTADCDVASLYFYLKPSPTQPHSTVISPNGGEVFDPGSRVPIIWKDNANYSKVKIMVVAGRREDGHYTNNGSMATTRGYMIYEGENTGKFDWVVPTEYPGPGRYLIRIDPQDGVGSVGYSDDYFTITKSEKIVTEKLPDATKNKYYTANIQTEGFATSTLKWQIINGTLPAGLHIQKNEDVYCLPVYPGNCSTPDSVLFGGMISGKPTQEGTYTFTVKVSTETQSATKSYSINVVNLPNLPDQLISVVSPNGGEQLVSGSIHQIKWNYPNATSTSKVDLYLVDPGSSYYPCVRTASSCTPSFRADLDKNIFANTTYSWIVGTDIVNNSIRPGYYLMQICIAGTNDCDVSNKTLEITSLNSSPRIEPSALPNSPVTSYYSQELEVIGFSTSTVTWQIVGGSLPQGLYLEKQGLTCTSSYPPICPRPETIMFKALIVGMPTKAGNYNFTVKASNGTQSVTKTYSLNLY